MNFHQNVLSTIGNTPLIRLNETSEKVGGLVLGKIEAYNPGLSAKDRIALRMVEIAEEKGFLKKGSTLIECTSGNTGIGLAIVAAVKGYRCIVTMSDKQSKEKIAMLRAFGVEVIVCPTKVAPTDPRSFYEVAKKLSQETPNAYLFNQYDNSLNPQAHYDTTAPEIWEQTNGKITHFVAGIGTGGTLTGVGRFLKEKNPEIKIIGVDAYGSVYQKYFQTGEIDPHEIYPYSMEGIGKDFVPENVQVQYLDHVEKVSDRDAALTALRMTQKEGLFLGHSSGANIRAVEQLAHLFQPSDVVVVFSHDHGSRYLGKVYSQTW